MEGMIPPRLVLALVGLTAFVALKFLQSTLRWRSRSKGFPLPPGPRPWPIVGNYFDLPTTLAWERYRDMSKQHGDLLYFRTMGQDLLVLNSAKAAFDLLDKRSANYSDRPQSVLWEFLGSGWFFSMTPYGRWWRSHRREFWQQFYPETLPKYDPIQEQEVHKFLLHILEDSTDFKEELRYMFGAIILRIVYNINTQGRHDPIIIALEDALGAMSASLIPGTSIVQFLPFLQYLPPFRRQLLGFKAASDSMRDLPYADARVRREDPEYVSVMDALEERAPRSGGELGKEIAKNVAGISYGAGGETIYSTLQTFLLAMSLYPEVQKRAQAELDTKIGRDRLPNANDRDDLPYIQAVVKESFRWMPVTPIGVPHAAIDDDIYEGYFIPAGTTVIANSWAFLHDPAVYPDPREFRPERFLMDGELDPKVPDPMLYGFGFGRRICPGRYFAERTTFIVIASILSTFNVTPPLDDAGQTIRVEPRQTNGQVSFPQDCRCTITPRSEAAAELVRRAVKDERAAV